MLLDLYFFFCFMLKWFQTYRNISRAVRNKDLHPLHPNFPIVNILYLFHYHLLSSCLFWHDALSPLNSQCVPPKHNDTVLYCHRPALPTRKSTLAQHYPPIRRPHSHCAHRPSNLSFSFLAKDPIQYHMWHLMVMSHQSLLVPFLSRFRATPNS